MSNGEHKTVKVAIEHIDGVDDWAAPPKRVTLSFYSDGKLQEIVLVP